MGESICRFKPKNRPKYDDRLIWDFGRFPISKFIESNRILIFIIILILTFDYHFQTLPLTFIFFTASASLSPLSSFSLTSFSPLSRLNRVNRSPPRLLHHQGTQGPAFLSGLFFGSRPHQSLESTTKWTMSNEMSDTNPTDDSFSESIPQLETHDGARSKAGTSKLKRKRYNSWLEEWDHFTKFTNNNGELKARCNYCHWEFYCHLGNNEAFALKNHMGSCVKFPRASGDPSQAKFVLNSGEDGSLVTWKFDQDAIRKSVVKMTIIDDLPFRFVEEEGFRRFMSLTCPRFHVPSRWVIARDCYQLYIDEKTRLRQFLKSSSVRVSLTIDTWTSLQGINYVCLMAHFIDTDWKLNKRILNFCPIFSHKSEAIGKAIEKCLRDWGINKIFTITVDNASSNNVAISYLRNKFNNARTSIVGGKYLHLRCIAHNVNLIVNDELKEMVDSVARVRGAVRYMRQSPSRLAIFKECIAYERIQSKSLLCLDVSTRWDSTYLMLEQAQKFERAFEAFDEADPNFKSELLMGDAMPDQNDWASVRRLCLFLQKFYNLIIKVSCSSYVTADTFLEDICEVYDTLQDWQLNSDVVLSAMAKRIKNKFDKYWENVENMNMLLYIASILDPRKKFAFVEFCFLEMYSQEQAIVMIKKVQEAIGELFDEYKKMVQSQSVNVGESSQASQVIKSTDKLRIGAIMAEFKKYRMESGKYENKSELERYLNEEPDAIKEGVEFDVLLWWKQNSHRFPILSHLASDVLAVPISTVAFESAFSTDRRVLDAYKSSLTPKLVQALICAQDWLHCSSHFNPTAFEDELSELDQIDLDLSKIALDPIIDQ